VLDRDATYLQFDSGRIGLRQLRPGSGPHPLLCFPHAGAQSLSFRAFAEALSISGAVYAIDPPGHGWAQGPVTDDFDGLVRKYLDQLPPALLEDGILLGHSMGAYAVLSLAHALSTRGTPPAAVIVSASRPPHVRPCYESLADMGHDKLVDLLSDLGGVPEPARGMLDLFAPVIRADFRALELYRAPESPCPVHALVLGGLRDHFCIPQHLREWDRYFPRRRLEWIDAGHVFVQTHPGDMARHVERFLRELPA
jgi:surfactin synthase thioesterase subunit